MTAKVTVSNSRCPSPYWGLCTPWLKMLWCSAQTIVTIKERRTILISNIKTGICLEIQLKKKLFNYSKYAVVLKKLLLEIVCFPNSGTLTLFQFISIYLQLYTFFSQHLFVTILLVSFYPADQFLCDVALFLCFYFRPV